MKIEVEISGILANFGKPKTVIMDVPDDQFFHRIYLNETEYEEYIVKGSLTTIKLLRRIDNDKDK